MPVENTFKLTEFSHGSGCGCKIAPARLAQILAGKTAQPHANLLVGNNSNDDAAVYKLNDTDALISTTDFFMPIVNDAFQFGRIAAANALSDVYAMGGNPIMALAILGWPVDKLPDELAAEVMAGGRDICEQAGIPLAGGHSIDNLEPLFGLSVNGLVKQNNLKRNSTAQEGDVVYLTKPLGTGIIATAIKRGKASKEHIDYAISMMTQLNAIGARLGEMAAVSAMTDVTGFGLMGHLLEMAENANLTAELKYDDIPKFPDEYLSPYIQAFVLPDNTFRNYNSYKERIQELSATQLPILCDPQTSGGLLISVNQSAGKQVETLLADNGLYAKPIGFFKTKEEKHVIVK